MTLFKTNFLCRFFCYLNGFQVLMVLLKLPAVSYREPDCPAYRQAGYVHYFILYDEYFYNTIPLILLKDQSL
jgi:hypothetical protein